jgi:luciferase family oxidoreductase group 1
LAIGAELRRFLGEGFPAEHAFHAIQVTPLAPVPVWVLGSSMGSARLAGSLGLPYVFAHHFAARTVSTSAALEQYRESFEPQADLAAPHAAISVEVLAAESDSVARAHVLAGGLSVLQSRGGRMLPLASTADAEAYRFSAEERHEIDALHRHSLIGSADDVAQRARDVIARHGPDEVFLTTRAADPVAKRRSFKLLAEKLDLVPEQIPDRRSLRR